MTASSAAPTTVVLEWGTSPILSTEFLRSHCDVESKGSSGPSNVAGTFTAGARFQLWGESYVVGECLGHGSFGYVAEVSDTEGRTWAAKVVDAKYADKVLVEVLGMMALRQSSGDVLIPQLKSCGAARFGIAPVSGEFWVFIMERAACTLKDVLDYTRHRKQIINIDVAQSTLGDVCTAVCHQRQRSSTNFNSGAIQDALEDIGKVDCSGALQMSWTEVLRVATALASCLQSLHDVGFVHQDLKPANILIHPGGWPLLADLGCIALANDRFAIGRPLTHSDEVSLVGFNRQYASPEASKKEAVTTRSDMWSWALIMLELLGAGRRVPSRSRNRFGVAGVGRPSSLCCR